MVELEKLFTFIEETCERLGIDESHGLKHSKSCIDRVTILMEEFPDISEEERKLIIYSVAIHDMCDSKYTEVCKAAEDILKWLLEQGWSKDLTFALIGIITTMSYTKLKNKRLENGGQIIYPNHGIWQRAFHIVRQADLIDAYIVGRCYMFQRHKYPDMNEDDCWKTVENVFESRILKYISDGWIFDKKALEIALVLQETARKDLLSRKID